MAIYIREKCEKGSQSETDKEYWWEFTYKTVFQLYGAGVLKDIMPIGLDFRVRNQDQMFSTPLNL